MPRHDDVSLPEAGSNDRDSVDIGRAAFLSGDVGRARRLADEAISENPQRSDAWILKGRTLVIRYDPVGAKECYDQALDIDDNNKAWSRKAFAHRIGGEVEQAIACWKRALEIDPQDGRILNDIASAFDDLEEYQNAIDYYERALEVTPDDIFAQENIRLNRRILKRIMIAGRPVGQNGD